MSAIAPETRALARRLRAEMTPQERSLWRQLRDLNHRLGFNFRRQAAIGRYVTDFADLGRRLVIEVDGGQHGDAYDLARDAWLKSQGFRVLRFWNGDVDRNADGVMEMVLDAVGVDIGPSAVPPPPSPPHAGEGSRVILGESKS